MTILPDSSVFIPYLGRRAYSVEIGRALADARLALSSVVAVEIMAGARNEAERQSYVSFFGKFERQGMVVTPDDVSWRACGRMLSRYSERFGAIEPRVHQNDVLILLSALRLAQEQPVELMTENYAHFATWLRFVHNRAGLRITAVRRA